MLDYIYHVIYSLIYNLVSSVKRKLVCHYIRNVVIDVITFLKNL